MQIIQIISEHKKIKINIEGRKKKNTYPKQGYKRVEAIVANSSGYRYTKHLDVPK